MRLLQTSFCPHAFLTVCHPSANLSYTFHNAALPRMAPKLCVGRSRYRLVLQPTRSWNTPQFCRRLEGLVPCHGFALDHGSTPAFGNAHHIGQVCQEEMRLAMFFFSINQYHQKHMAKVSTMYWLIFKVYYITSIYIYSFYFLKINLFKL